MPTLLQGGTASRSLQSITRTLRLCDFGFIMKERRAPDWLSMNLSCRHCNVYRSTANPPTHGFLKDVFGPDYQALMLSGVFLFECFMPITVI
jgi:hypothetical protein